MTNFLMNAPTNTAKRILCAATLFFGLGLTAQAQIGSIAALTPDYQVGGSTMSAGSIHTGTDGLIFNAGPYSGQSLQVMTWDAPTTGNTVALAWSIQNGTSPPTAAGTQTITRSTTLGDPDVVVAQDATGTVWANLVYTQVNGGGKPQTMYEVYKWNGAGFAQVGSSIALGDPLYEHKSPNIDANANGLVGVVWQQRRTVIAQVSVTSPSPIPEFSPFTYTQTYTFDRSYLATGNITGTFNTCNYNNGTTGAPVSHPSQLVEQTLQPDVAVSEGINTNTIVSVSYVRHYVDNGASNTAFGIKDELVINQFAYGVCNGEAPPALVFSTAPTTYSWTLPGLNDKIVPRIAATSDPAYPGDVEVVLAWIPGTGCGGGAATFAIRNYGKYKGAFRPNFVLVSQPNTQIEALQPAISYIGGTNGYYAITWTGKNYPITSGTTPGDDYDVLGVTMLGGEFVNNTTGTTQPTTPFKYSFVNKVLKLAQQYPSVAGRHLFAGNTMHLFRDDYAGKMSFKASNGTGGVNQYRPAAPGSGAQPGAQSKTPDMGSKAYPNPADGTVYLQVPLREGERVQQVLVTDAMGRTVDRLPVAADANGEALTWKPAGQLPAGSYFFKLTTTQRSESIPVHRN